MTPTTRHSCVGHACMVMVERPRRPNSKEGPAASLSIAKNQESHPMEPPQAAPAVGIDVSKAKLDVAVGDEPVFTLENNPAGHDALERFPLACSGWCL